MTTTEETTVGQLAELVENYYGLKERIEKLEKTKEMTEKLILEAFALTGMKTFTTPSGLLAQRYTSIFDKDCNVTGPLVHLRVFRARAEKSSSHGLNVNMHFQNQG